MPSYNDDESASFHARPVQNSGQSDTLGYWPLSHLDVQVYHCSQTVPNGRYSRDFFEILVAVAHGLRPLKPVIEIMQPLKGKTPMQDFFDRNGGGEGVQHTAFDIRTCL